MVVGGRGRGQQGRGGLQPYRLPVCELGHGRGGRLPGGLGEVVRGVMGPWWGWEAPGAVFP